jgi:hypothetical protein
MSNAGWVVVVPQKSWTRCYGPFDSYMACIAWIRQNQFEPSDVDIYPIEPIKKEDT